MACSPLEVAACVMEQKKLGQLGRDGARRRRQSCLQGLGGLMHHRAQGPASGAPGRTGTTLATGPRCGARFGNDTLSTF